MSHCLHERCPMHPRIPCPWALKLTVLAVLAVVGTGSPIAFAQQDSAADTRTFVPVVREGEGLTPGNSLLPLPGSVRNDRVIELGLARNNIPADGHTRTRLTVRLLDANNQPVKGRTLATIDFTGVRVQLLDRMTDESGPGRGDLDRVTPGVQIELNDGLASFDLIAPSEPKDAQVRVTTQGQSVTATIRYLVDKREMVGIGVVEGILLMQNKANPGVTDDGIERELRHFQREFANGRTTAAISSELYFKGLVKGDYLLTVAYDSDKDARSRLFRDIQPDEYYPVFGDASIKGFDAQSASRLYVRVDADRSYVLFGDYTTRSQFESMALSNYQRSLTGGKWHYESDKVSATAFAALDNLRQVVEEQPARGVSGPYFVSNLNGVRYTEKVDIVTRDRNQPAVILQVQAQQRFVDYTFEPFSGQVVFKAPIPTVDANFNPLTIRITYEVEQGGPTFWVAGGDVQVKLAKNVAVGASIAEDRNPQAPYKLYGVNTSIKLGEKTVLLAEVVRSDGHGTNTTVSSSSLVVPDSGTAERIEFRSSGESGSVRLYAARASLGFYNPSASLAAGRTEISGRGDLRLSDSLQLFGEVTRSEDEASGAKRSGVTGGVQLKLSDSLSIDVYGRVSRSEGPPISTNVTDSNIGTFNPATGQNLTNFGLNNSQVQAPQLYNANSLGIKLRYKFNEKSSAIAEIEREVAGEQRNRYALGLDYQIAEHLRLYARHEWLSSTSGLYGSSPVTSPTGTEVTALSRQTVFGLSSNYMEGGDVYSEYRIRDSISGYEAQAAMGIRNTWPLAKGVALLTSLERVQTTSLELAPDSTDRPTKATAAAVGIEITTNPDWKASAKVEVRQDTENMQVLLTAGGALKLDRNLTALARNYYSRAWGVGSTPGSRTQERFQLGVAWRDTDVNVWSWLARYEYRYDNDTVSGLLSRANILAGTVNYHPSRPLWVSGQVALKLNNDGADGKYTAWLVGGRVIYDISERWDVSLAGFTLNSPTQSSRQYAAGLEVGYLVAQNLWLSGGYNFKGFNSDLALDDYTQRGVFLRLRAKFDETFFGNTRDERTDNLVKPAAER